MPELFRYLVAHAEGRLDRFLCAQQPHLSRSHLQRLIREGCATVNGQRTKAGQRLLPGDEVILTLPDPVPLELEPEPLPLTVVYEDACLLVVDKPAGMVVHPGAGHHRGTLVHALLAHCPDLRGIGEVLRPGIVHRLDKDTSGLMVVAKTQGAHESLARQFKDRVVSKEYLALVKGQLQPPSGCIEAPLGRDPRNRQRMAVVEGGREARTAYRALQLFSEATLVEVRPETGRTHQIRAHFAALHHPILGDAVYGGRTPRLGRPFLHASRLGFHHPEDGRYLEFTAELPPELSRFLEALACRTPGNPST